MYSFHKYCLRYLRKPLIQHCRCSCSNDSKTKHLQESSVDKKKYDPKDVTKEDMRWRTPMHQKEGDYYNFLRVFYDEDNQTSLLKKLHTPIDLSPSSMKRWWAKKKEEYEIIKQSYIPERNQMLGDELAAAHFIVSRGGAVKFFNEDKWIKADENQNYNLPRFFEEDKIVEGIDCSGMTLYYEGFVNMTDLKNVQWLSLNGCENIDDWCLDKMTNIFSHSLIYLDLRNCPNITYRGLSTICKMRHLKILYLDDFLRSTLYEYTCLLLEELMPNLEIKSDPIKFEAQ